MASAFETAWTCFEVTLQDRVAHIRLNRPEAFNAMNRAFWNELPAIVDDISVRAEVAACVELPCKETEQARFREASLVGSATLSRVGQTLIGSVRVQSGLKEVVRVNGQGTDAGAVVQQMGFDAGAMLRAAISASAPPPPPPPSEER